MFNRSQNGGDTLPVQLWANNQSKFGLTAYAYGPTGVTGKTLNSGEYYQGYWGGIINKKNVILTRLASDEDFINYDSTGYNLNWFENIPIDNTSFYKNISFCFNNTGQPLFAVQETSLEDIDRISLWFPSGNTVANIGWLGASPALYNTVQINFPTFVPDLLYPIWRTGEVFCFYYTEGNNLKYRRMNENFTGEYSIITGSNVFEGQQLRPGNFENIDISKERNPYRIVLAQKSSDSKTLKTISSKSYVNFAFESFSTYSTGGVNILGTTGYFRDGYGEWMRVNKIGSTSGQSSNVESFIYDDFSQYSSNTSPVLNKHNNYLPFLVTGLYTGTYFYNEFYFYDDMSLYQEGHKNNLDKGIYFSGKPFTGSFVGFTSSIESYFYDDFSSYQLKNVKFLRQSENFGDSKKEFGFIIR
jgi:hypothetical protein